MMPRERLTPKETQVATLVWEGLTNREIGKIMRTTEQVVKNHLRSSFDRVWSRLDFGYARGQPWWQDLAGRREEIAPDPCCA